MENELSAEEQEKLDASASMGATSGIATVEENAGAFLESLYRNNKAIRRDRATSIGEDAELRYKRYVEDLGIKIRVTKRERENMLDLSPTNAQSLTMAKDFESLEFVQKDMELTIKLRNLEIEYDLGVKRYNYLFGKSI